MTRTLFRQTVLTIAALGVFSHAGSVVAGVTTEDVNKSIEKGRAKLTKDLLTLKNNGFESGYSILAVMALLNCGTKPDDHSVALVIKNLTSSAKAISADAYYGTYRAGLLLTLLAMTHDASHKATATEVARILLHHQAVNGGWGDNSRTQFALLGLKSAEDMGVTVPTQAFEKARRYMEGGQNPDGGWDYIAGRRQNSYGSMTVAGISSLFICGGRLYQGSKVCGQGTSDPRLAKGLEWMAKNFSVRTNPASGAGHHHYYLYGLERVGMLMAQKSIGGHDWYREGAEYLVRTQDGWGSWGNDMSATAFALLFLGKGSQPIAVQKLRHDGNWNRDPYDAKEITEAAARDLATPMTWQVVNDSSTAVELAAAPILYLQGDKGLALNEPFRKNLKLFIDDGGFVFASACCASAEFDKSFRQEMLKLYPDASFKALPLTHPVYGTVHKLEKGEAFMLEGLNTGCRTSVFYAPHDLCCGWGGCQGCADKGCVRDVEARKLGVNMIAYALGFNKLKPKLQEVELNLKPSEVKVERGALVIGQLYHSGDWDPDPAALPNLTQTLKEQAGMRGKVSKKRVVLGVDDPGEYPLLYLTGHKAFSFGPEQVKALRAYLDKGGFLLAEPCCGKAEFDVAYRQLCAQLYPDTELERVKADHAIFQAPYRIETVRYKIGAKRYFPDLGGKPHLETIQIKGQLAVVYSRFNMGCELQGHACANCVGMEREDAYKLAVNAIMYALSK